MSDCFDHQFDAMESREQMHLWGECEPNIRCDFIPDPLHYHVKVQFDEFVAETDKAIKMRLTEEQIDVWFPRSVCKNWNFEDRTVYVHRQLYNKNIKRYLEEIEHG